MLADFCARVRMSRRQALAADRRLHRVLNASYFTRKTILVAHARALSIGRRAIVSELEEDGFETVLYFKRERKFSNDVQRMIRLNENCVYNFSSKK